MALHATNNSKRMLVKSIALLFIYTIYSVFGHLLIIENLENLLFVYYFIGIFSLFIVFFLTWIVKILILKIIYSYYKKNKKNIVIMHILYLCFIFVFVLNHVYYIDLLKNVPFPILYTKIMTVETYFSFSMSILIAWVFSLGTNNIIAKFFIIMYILCIPAIQCTFSIKAMITYQKKIQNKSVTWTKQNILVLVLFISEIAFVIFFILLIMISVYKSPEHLYNFGD